MRFFDLLRLVIDNLSRRKARVGLTAIGVVIGTAAVVVLVSLAIGLQQNANSQLYGIGDLTQIQVYPGYGNESGGMGFGGGGGGGGGSGMVLITNETLETFRAIPGVKVVVPRDYLMAESMMRYGRLEAYASLVGVGLTDLSELGLKAQSGALTLGRGEVVIGMNVPLNFYDPRLRPGQEPPAPPELLGEQLRLTAVKYDSEGNPVRKNYTLRVVGVLQQAGGEADYSIYINLDELTAINEWATGRRINRARDGYNGAIVKMDDVDTVLDAAAAITTMGYQAYTDQTYVQGINNFYTILQLGFAGVGAIALLVAAIGIANTMTMSILERTREIGLMKAVGATNRDVLSIFLGEAAGIGFLGGFGGAVVGWLAGQIINVIALAYLVNQTAQQGGAPPSVAVVTPLWLPLFTLLFATLVGLISGLYPALRAATMIPVNALKYE